jgi:O-antigen/teichoic acid export membrane protein
MAHAGALVFGVVIGWVTYRTLRRREGAVGLSDIATVIGAVGGAAVVELFGSPDIFGWYAIGLGIGFFGYLGLAWRLEGKKISGWMGVNGDAAPDEHWGRP